MAETEESATTTTKQPPSCCTPPNRAFTQLQEESANPAVDARPSLPGFSAARKLLFFSTYLMYICVNTVNGPLMPAMKVSLDFTSHDGATIAAVQTVGISAGKLVYGGWPVDACGARRTYAATMLLIGVLACTYSIQTAAPGVAAVAFLVEFFSTPAYPCHVQLIRGWMPADDVGAGFWLLGMSSRVGDMLSKLSYGSLLSVLAWQQLTLLAAGLGGFAALVGGALHSDTPTARNAPGVRASPAELRAVLRRMLCSGRFWLAASAASATTCMKRTLEMLVALFFFDCGGGFVSQGAAAQLAMTWSGGLATSVLVAGWLFNRLPPRGKLALMAALMSTTVLCCAALSSLARVEAASWDAVGVRAVLVFVAALGVGMPYYVPTGIFSVQFGGANSGVVSAYLDTASFAVSGAFIYALGPIFDGSAGWATVWGIMAVTGVVMMVLQLAFLRMLLYTSPTSEGAKA
tara:strand:- start:293 stop:1678 length:1386 start_codon:yes stop_codon:yes gene_type:complete